MQLARQPELGNPHHAPQAMVNTFCSSRDWESWKISKNASDAGVITGVAAPLCIHPLERSTQKAIYHAPQTTIDSGVQSDTIVNVIEGLQDKL